MSPGSEPDPGMAPIQGPPDTPHGLPIFATAGPQRSDPRTIVAGVAPLVLMFAGINALSGPQVIDLVIIAIIGLIMGVTQAVQWSHRWYEISDTELRVRWGILSRDQRVVPFTRIQQVDQRQKLIYQILGLALVQIETAADSGKTTISVDALPVNEAERLRTFLLDRRRNSISSNASSATPVAPPQLAQSLATLPEETQPVVVLEIPDSRLAVAGATGSGLIGAILVVLAPLSWLYEGGLVSDEQVSEVTEGAAASAAADPFLIALAIAGVVLLLPVGAAVLYIFQWHGYQLASGEDDILVRHGLFEVRRLTIPRRRIHQVIVRDNPVRRRLGLVTIHLQSAAGGVAGTNVLTIPLARGDDAGSILERILLDERWSPAPVTQRPPAALRRAIVRRVLAVALLLSPGVLALGVRSIVLAPLLLVGVKWGRAAHRRAGFGASNGTATIAKGVIVHTKSMVALERLQSTRVSSSPLQRRSDLATLALDIAGTRAAPSLGDMDADSASRLLLDLHGPVTGQPGRGTNLHGSRPRSSGDRASVS